jgi:hypothetical protein
MGDVRCIDANTEIELDRKNHNKKITRISAMMFSQFLGLAYAGSFFDYNSDK